jgi:hypothetical protein
MRAARGRALGYARGARAVLARRGPTRALRAILALAALLSVSRSALRTPPLQAQGAPPQQPAAPAHSLVLDLPGEAPPAVSALTPLLARDATRYLHRYLAAAAVQLDCPHTQLLLAAYDDKTAADAEAALRAWQPGARCGARLVIKSPLLS